MKRIDTYIQEKLHINKDVKVINEIDNMSIKEFMKYLGCEEITFNKIGTYHADKKLAEVYKIPETIRQSLNKFYKYKTTLQISYIKEISDICKEIGVDVNCLKIIPYPDEPYFKIKFVNKIDQNQLFHISFEKDMWWVQDYKDLDDNQVNKYINVFKKIIIYIIDNYK